ncbi:TetR/AcrR family transcriptional regulator [Streptomyces sp. NBC_01477]|uniref:TetR/AcrR family transcriptional regulator n=1 Tax=Streptomyces sp. NBC_01477 TaxID=2976015 RepID=UPI002E321F5A|nr:helix-turn-helix domain-containing protein [Streptomyces sp. NBC_01477]
MSDTKRADGQRNYERLLSEARAAFAEHGTDVSLRDVARRAGVGIGTLYRHFPTRDALIEAAFRHGLEDLADRAGVLLDAESPSDALAEWLLAFAAAFARYQGLPASLLAALRDETSSLHESCEGMRDGAGRLLARAQRDGAIRPDLTVGELLSLTTAVAWAAQQSPPGTDPTARLLGLLRTGIAV